MTETHLFIALYALTFARLVVYFQPSLISEPLKRRNVNEFIDSIVHAGVSALLLIHFIVRSYYIPSGSMIPTLEIKDYILVNELQYRFTKPARGDVAVFHPPATYHGNKEDLIKRVVGIEGDTISVKGGQLYRNGVKVDEPFIKEPIREDFAEIRVGPGRCFMMGDNRNDSFDSRFWGDVPYDHYVGKAEFIFWPPQRAGRIR